MSPIFAIVIFIALHVVPKDVAEFRMDLPGGAADGKTEELIATKQADGSWLVSKVPDEALGFFKVDGTSLKVTAPAGEAEGEGEKPHQVDIGKFIRLGDAVDWSSVAEFTSFDEGKVTLSRHPGRVTIEISGGAPGQDGGGHGQVAEIRWKVKASE